jgi:hypothetical protein
MFVDGWKDSKGVEICVEVKEEPDKSIGDSRK